MKRRILLLMMTALLSVGAWAADDLTLNASETVAFGDWGFDNSGAPTLNFTNWAAGGGWQFATPLSQDDYCGVDFVMEPTVGDHVTFTITFEGGETQNIDVPAGTTSIKAGFAFNGGITKIGFSHGDHEGGVDPAVITITSAVVKANSTGEVTELTFANLSEPEAGSEAYTKDAATQSITINKYTWASYWSFDPAISSDDYEKIVVTFAEAVPVSGLTINAEVTDDASWCGTALGSITKGATKATAYFSELPGASITKIGFYLDWQAESATLKIAKVELVKKASAETPTEPTEPTEPSTPDTENELVKDDSKTADDDDAHTHTDVYTLGTGTGAKTLTIIVEKTEDSENSGTYNTNGTISASATTADDGITTITTITLTPTPADNNYKLSKLIIEETADAGSANTRTPAVGNIVTATKQTNGTWTFTMPKSSVIILAKFAVPQKPTLAYDKANRTVTITNTEYAEGNNGNNVKATLYYTLNNGTEQTTTDASVSEVITVNTAVKAWIVSTGTGDSEYVEEPFSVAAKPTVAYTDGENKVSLALTPATATNTADSKLYYTTDGNDPTTSSTQLTANGTINITEGMTTIKVLALDADGNYSEIVTQNVTYAYYLTASKEWTTYYSDKTFSVPDGLTAYTVTSVTAPTNGQSGKVVVAEQQVIAKNTPMLIQNKGFATTTKYRVTTTTDQIITEGIASEFKGADTNFAIPNDGKLRYILVDGVFLRTTGGTLPANRCYLEFGSTPAQTRSFSITVGDKTTAIESVGITTQEGEDLWYDLQGRRVMQPQKGIYIRNGKKVVVR